jgi:nucleotide-binding universal stress UspA family protein
MSTRVSEDGIPCESWLTEGEPAEAIVEAARQWSAELVVMATHGSGARNRCPSGSIASHVGARLDRSILMVSCSEAGIAPLRPHRYRRLLVPLDCSPRSNAVVQIAVALARPCEAEIVLAHVVPVPEMPRAEVLLDAEDLRVRDLLVASNRRLAQRTLEGLSGGPRSLSIPTRTRMEDSAHVSQALFRLVEEEAPDLVLMSAHGCGYAAAGVPAWPYGSVSGHMLMYGPVPRMIVKDEATRPQPVNRDRASAAVPGRQPLIG